MKYPNNSKKHVKIPIITVFSKIVKIVSSSVYVLKCYTTFQPRLYASYFSCSENIVKSPAEQLMSQSHFSTQLYASSVVGRFVWAASGTAFNEAG